MSGRVAVTVTTLTLLTCGVLGVAATQPSASLAPATSTLPPFDALDPVPMPAMVPLAPVPVAMPLVEPHGRPVPMPLVHPDRSAAHPLPQELRRAR